MSVRKTKRVWRVRWEDEENAQRRSGERLEAERERVRFAARYSHCTAS